MEIAVAVLAVLLAAVLARDLLAQRGRAGGSAGNDAALLGEELRRINDGVSQVSELVRRTSGEGQAKFGELSLMLRSVGEQTGLLTNVLGNSRLRGQWGERTAEDILRVAGFIEGINYYKQVTLEGTGRRPDFVFPLPRDMRVNMDVKFPLDNYARAVEADDDAQRSVFERAFLKDVRDRIKELGGREYVDPEGGTVDYVLLFIPSESVYAVISQLDPGLLEGALRQRVVCCSPLTLFAVLSVIRQAMDSFSLQRASDEVVSLVGRFSSEWQKFTDALAKLGRGLDTTQTAYANLVGPRKRQLERSLERIDAVRQQRGLSIASEGTGELRWAQDGGEGEAEDERSEVRAEVS